MITLITGGPGTGKTAWLLDQLVELRKAEPNRHVYIHGVRGLRKFPHELIYCKSQLCDICQSATVPDNAKYVEKWPEWKSSGDLIIVDEVQRIWRPRVGSSAAPESVTGLETHRHYGLDFWLISQGPHLFDNFIRLLVGRHVHLVARWSGRTQYEWPECKQDVQSRSDAVIRPYRLPSHVYDMYDSAEVHTKQDKRKPISFYVTIAALVLALVTVSFVVYRIKRKMSQATETMSDPALTTNNSNPNQTESTTNGYKPPAKVSFPDFTPTVPGIPESAPAYAHLIKVTAAPILAGCVINNLTDNCQCYTNQATPYQVSQEYCKEAVKGHRFNPYLQAKTIDKNNKNNPNQTEQPLILGSATE